MYWDKLMNFNCFNSVVVCVYLFITRAGIIGLPIQLQLHTCMDL